MNEEQINAFLNAIIRWTGAVLIAIIVGTTLGMTADACGKALTASDRLYTLVFVGMLVLIGYEWGKHRR